MANVERLSFSIEQPLLERLERLVQKSGYANRSEYIRDLIRDRLVQEQWKQNEEALGAITLVYDHHSHQLSNRLMDLQHDFHDIIMATTHVHLDHHHCAEMIMARGKAQRLEELAALLRQQKGVLHAALSMSALGTKLA